MHARPSIPNLRQFIDLLRKTGDLVEIPTRVSAHLEVAEIHRRVIAADGPALLFPHVDGSAFPLVTNLFGARRRIELAFGHESRNCIEGLVQMIQKGPPTSLRHLWSHRQHVRPLLHLGVSTRSTGPCLDVRQSPPNLTALPLLTTWPKDGGAFMTLPLVYTEHPHTRTPNLGMYRMQRFGETETGMHWQIGKGGGFHYAVAEAENKPLPVTVFLGGPPALTLAAIAPLPENVSELLLASFLMGKKLRTCRAADSTLPIIADAEFALVGEVAPQRRRPEGPFGDHYGYYSLQHDYPVLTCHALYHQQNAIYPATVVGKPRQEDFYLGDYIQELLSPLFPLAMPGVTALWSYGETGYHALSAAIIKDRYPREAMASAFRILGEGQLSLSKFLLVLDRPPAATGHLRNFKQVLTHVLERAQFERDLYLFGNLAMDTLDYTGPEVNRGSKGVLLGLGDPVRTLPTGFSGDLPGGVHTAIAFCPGALVVSGPSYRHDPGFAQILAADTRLDHWPMVVLVDDAARTAKSEINFLWTTFTRFEPAADIYPRRRRFVQNCPSYSFPIVIDARMKPSYPEELFCDDATRTLVDQRWTAYFPDGNIEMGDSDRGHLD